MGFFSFTKGKVTVFSVLIILALVQAFLFNFFSVNSLMFVIGSILFGLMIIPLLLRNLILYSSSLRDNFTASTTVFLILAIAYSYLLSGLIVFLWNKIFSKHEELPPSQPGKQEVINPSPAVVGPQANTQANPPATTNTQIQPQTQPGIKLIG